ncbi:MAG: magnesium transporter [Thermoanaerobaculales bacterium]|nr:magnesium transporter [Thermoanaerobaculales bacterium]
MTAAGETTGLSAQDLREIWPVLDAGERTQGFSLLEREEAVDFFQSLSAFSQAQIVEGLHGSERRLWLRSLAPDDAADLLQELDPELRTELLDELDPPTRHEVAALMAYAQDDAGGLMSPRYARIRSEQTADEAIRYLRRQARDQLETIYYAYVLDSTQRLLGVVSFRELFAAAPDRPVRELMSDSFIFAPDDMDQEEVARLLARHDLLALPVVDAAGRMKGIVTVDDIVDVVQEEATEDAHKAAGMQALDAPYLQTGMLEMVRKRAVWLTVLFLGQTLTASAMGHFEEEIASAVVLALFVPLIVSSGGNSGSQTTTLVIRAMALGEVQLRDWWRILRRELVSGLVLGAILATLGLLRIVAWQTFFGAYGDLGYLVAVTVAASLVGVVVVGTLCGAMLPFVLRLAGADPASASAPFVATLVDVSGVVIYFTLARLLLSGSLL